MKEGKTQCNIETKQFYDIQHRCQFQDRLSDTYACNKVCHIFFTTSISSRFFKIKTTVLLHEISCMLRYITLINCLL